MEYIKSVEIREEDNFEATAIIRFTEKMEVLSSAPQNGGHAVTDTVFIMQVPHDYVSADYLADLRNKTEQYSLPKDSVGFMTAAEVKYVFTDCEKTVDGETVYVASTAGVTNCVCAGDRMEGWEHRKARSDEIYRRLIAGTINTVVVTSRPLTDPAKINLRRHCGKIDQNRLFFQFRALYPYGHVRQVHIQINVIKLCLIQGEQNIHICHAAVIRRCHIDLRRLKPACIHAALGKSVPVSVFKNQVDRLRERTIVFQAIILDNRFDIRRFCFGFRVNGGSCQGQRCRSRNQSTFHKHRIPSLMKLTKLQRMNLSPIKPR